MANPYEWGDAIDEINAEHEAEIDSLERRNADLLAALKRAVNCIDPIGNLRRLSPVEEATAKQGREAIAKAGA